MSEQKIKLPGNSLEFSRFTFGVWRLNDWKMTPSELEIHFKSIYDLGITTFDHADIYGSYTCEERWGESIGHDKNFRKKIQMVSKCGIKLVSPNRPEHKIKMYDTSRSHITNSVDRSLKNLKTDYLDLLLLHRPDPFMNADETAETLSDLIQSGRIRAVGVSNFNPSQIDLLGSRMKYPIVTNQVECSLLHLEPIYNGVFDHCQKLKYPPMIWSPLAGGKIFNEQSERAQRVRNTLGELSVRYQTGTDQIALAWLLAHPANLLPVLGSGNFSRIESAVKSLSVKLSREDWFYLLKASTGNDVP